MIDMINEMVQIVIGLISLVVPLALIAAYYYRPDFILKQWANENRYEILRRERRQFLRGPFFFTASNGQTVYRVTVRAWDGKIYTGWVRCGGWLLGIFVNKADARWD